MLGTRQSINDSLFLINLLVGLGSLSVRHTRLLFSVLLFRRSAPYTTIVVILMHDNRWPLKQYVDLCNIEYSV